MKITIDENELLSAIRLILKEELEKLTETPNGFINVKKPVSTKELMEFLDVTEPTLIKWRKKGKIPFLNIGNSIRYDLNKVMLALESSEPSLVGKEHIRTKEKHERKTISDPYVKKLIKKSIKGLKGKDIPEQIIDAKRTNLKLKRTIKSKKDAIAKPNI